MSNHVIIKGKNDRLVIALNPDIDFLDICDILKTKILEAKNFIGNSRMAIEFSGRALTNEEEMDLENINPLIEEGKTHFFRGTLRSGSKIESDGNVVVLGDVNPSSIIKARGNVIVLGHLNGTVYAGLGGDDRAFIGAIYFNPIQLTIGMKTITDIQDEILDSSRVNKKSRFKVARIRNQEIVVEELI